LQKHHQLLSSLVVASLVVEDAGFVEPGDVGSVHRQSRVLFLRPATGVSGHVSLSSSEEEESRFSPVRGCFGRGELSAEENMRSGLVDIDSEVVDVSFLESVELGEAFESDEDDSDEVSVDRVETEDSRSECASMYLTLVISSSSGVRKDTRFSAGNMGLEEVILRGIIDRAGLLASIEARLCGCLYGMEMVADSCEEADVSADERVDAELGVVEALVAFGTLLLMERTGFEGRSMAGYALEKVLTLVGETALRVSSRRLAPLPKLRGVDVLTESFGRCPRGNIGSAVVMLFCEGAGDGAHGECDMVESIMRLESGAADMGLRAWWAADALSSAGARM
jgi:hypothetical protein